MGIGKGASQIAHLVIGLQHLFYNVGNLAQSGYHCQVLITVDGALSLA